MLEGLTFSACVDEIMAESGRVDKRALISDYVNTSVKECQAVALFASDMTEEEPVPTGDPFIWDVPSLLYKIKAVKYANGNWPDFIQPGKGQIDKDYYYYRTGSSFAFIGCGTSATDTVKIAYYSYRPRLRYYVVGQRPAIWDIDTRAWIYYDLTAYGMLDYTLPQNQELARDLVTNWLLFRHYDMIKEGGLAKIFKNVTDAVRSGMAFSLFSSLRADLKNFEAHESLDRG